MLVRVATRFSAVTFFMLICSGVCWWEQAPGYFSALMGDVKP